MKKTKYFCVLMSLLIIITFSGCKTNKTTITLSFDTQSQFDMESAIREYSKNSNINIKLVDIGKKESSDIFSFKTSDFDNIKGICENLDDLADYLYNKKLGFREDAETYGLPVFINYSAILYKKSDFDEITDYETFKNAILKAKQKYTDVFAISSEDKSIIADTVLGTALFYEFEMGDDYSFPINAASHSKKIALRYSENLKEFMDFIKGNVLVTDKTNEATESVMKGLAAFTFFSSLNNSLEEEKTPGLCPVFMGIDGEKSKTLTVFEDSFFAVNRGSSAEKISAAKSFLTWIFENGEKYLVNKSAILPYKNKTGFESSFKQQIEEILNTDKNPIISVSPAFPNGFSTIAADGITDYLNGSATWEYTEKLIAAAWENGR